jgi:hypothetical protein
MIGQMHFGYDYDSVMHYGPYDFSKNCLPTLMPTVSGVQIGQRTHLSKTDLQEMREAYKCD